MITQQPWSQAYPFPSDFVSPQVKADVRMWGLPAAKAIYYNTKKSGAALFSNDLETLNKCLDYALGEQSQDIYKPVMGISAKNSKRNFVRAMRWQIKNYATKRVNVAVSKIFNRNYEVTCDAIDPLALEEKEDYESRLRAYMKHSAWLREMGLMQPDDMTAVGIPFKDIPKNDEERQVHMEMDYKHRGAMEIEMGTAKHLERNKFDNTRAMYDFDLFAFGVGSVWVGMDENMRPVVKRRNPTRMIVPYSESEDFSNIPYAGYLEDMTVGDLRKLNRTLSDQQIKDIGENHAKRQTDFHYRENSDTLQFENVNKVQVMHFEILTTNEMVHLEKKDSFGNERFIEKDFSYYSTEKEQEKFKSRYGNTRKIHRTKYHAVYEGYWVVGTDYVFNYGLKNHTERQRGNLGETRLGYKVFAPNMKSGKVVSTVKQMIPILDDLQSYNLKIQQIIGRAIPKGFGIDMYALRKADLKWDGRKMSDQEKIEMFVQSGIFTYDSSGRYAPGSNYKPFIEAENGMAGDIEYYLRLIQQAIFELEEVTGINKIVAASSVHQDTGKGVAEMQQGASEVALDYLYRADKDIYTEVCKTLAVLHIQSVKYAGNKEYYTKSLGESTVDFLAGKDLTKYDYGLMIQVAPTEDEWREFYVDVQGSIEKGILRNSDKILLRRIKNLKQAYVTLKVLEERRIEEQQQSKMNDIKANGEEQRASVQAKFEADRMLEEMKSQREERIKMIERETEMLKHHNAIDLMQRQVILQGDVKSEHIEEQGEQDRQLERTKGSQQFSE
jgi:hypothetical protein